MKKYVTSSYEFRLKALTDYVLNYKELISVSKYCRMRNIKPASFYIWLTNFKETEEYQKLTNSIVEEREGFIDIKDSSFSCEHEKNTFHCFINGFEIVFSLDDLEDVIRRLYFYDRTIEN